MLQRVGTLNLASGRDAAGRPLDAAALRAALAGWTPTCSPSRRSTSASPARTASTSPPRSAAALGATDWRFAAAVAGTPDPFRSWTPVDPPVLRGPGEPLTGPHYGIALVSRLPVRRWSVHALGAGRARLPLRAPDPRTGGPAGGGSPTSHGCVAAELDGLHRRRHPPVLRAAHRAAAAARLRRWCATLPGPVRAGRRPEPGRPAAGAGLRRPAAGQRAELPRGRPAGAVRPRAGPGVAGRPAPRGAPAGARRPPAGHRLRVLG